jgi:hypothetical protein
MNAYLVIYVLVPIALVLLTHVFLLIFGRAAYFQRRHELVTREPGERWLGKPRDARPEAIEDLSFALLSQVAYQKPIDDEKIQQGKALDPDKALRELGWCRWTTFPGQDLQKSFDRVHLRLQVWSNRSTKRVVVTFGGTVARDWRDWLSDFRWFIPFHRDEYTKIVEEVGGNFLNAFHERQQWPGWEYLRESQLFSTGHSLGGGLAQEFAYSLPDDTHLHPMDFVHPVTKVYAFDPSPVTGFSSVAKKVRDRNRENLQIDRIYERGEILALVRSLTHFIHPPAKTAPAIRQVRYNLFYTMNPFAGHSMAEFAFQMRGVSQIQLVDPAPDCPLEIHSNSP